MSGVLGYERINEFLSEVSDNYMRHKEEVLDIDLTKLELIDPLSIVVLISLCRYLENSSVYSIINVPENMFPLDEFEKEFDQFVRIKTVKATEDFPNQLFKIFYLEPNKCKYDNYMDNIRDDVKNWVLNSGVTNRQMQWANIFIKEMLSNVNVHSMSEYCSLVLQMIKESNDQTRLVLAIGDNGIGIRKSLTCYSKSDDDKDKDINSRTKRQNLKESEWRVSNQAIINDIKAIQLTVNEGISRFLKGGAGLSGFGTLSRERDADFIIHSGNCIYGIIGKNSSELTRNLKHPLCGTNVCLVLYPM